MTLAARIDKLEVAAEPMIEEATRERKRRNIGKYATCKLLCYGFTHEEALDVLAEGSKKHGQNIAVLPHFTAPHNFELFQTFLDDDAEAARLYSTLTARRIEGVKLTDAIKNDAQLNEQITALAYQLQERLEAYFLDRDRTNYLEYKVLYNKGLQKVMAENEQATGESK